MKYVKGLGYLLSVEDYNNIEKYKNKYLIKIVKESKLTDDDLIDVLTMIKNGSKRATIYRKYNTTMYKFNKYLRTHGIKPDDKGWLVNGIDKKINELKEKKKHITK